MAGERFRYQPDQEHPRNTATETVVFDATEEGQRKISRQAEWEKKIKKYAAQGVPDASAKLEGIRRRKRTYASKALGRLKEKAAAGDPEATARLEDIRERDRTRKKR